VSRRADRTEHIGVGITLVLGLPHSTIRARAAKRKGGDAKPVALPPKVSDIDHGALELVFRREFRRSRLTAWLAFLDTYRTMCLAPEPAFRRILEDIRDLQRRKEPVIVTASGSMSAKVIL
jgi:hypothetical protein